MSRRIVGIDPSLTCTGIATLTRFDDHVDVVTCTAISSGRRADSLLDRRGRIRDLANRIVDHTTAPALAVIELPTFGVKGGSSLDRNGFWWFVVDAFAQREVPVATVTATSLKLAIAGKGNADKAAVAVAVERLWPGLEVSSSDVSDAVGLAHLGAVWLGWDVKTLDRHREVKAAWPVLPEPEREAS